MKTQLPPTPHSKLSSDIAHSRGRIFGISLTIIILLLAIAKSQAIAHAPSVSWVPDQRITSGNFVNQYIRIINFDGGTPMFMYKSTNPMWYPASKVTVVPCTGEAGCASDGTGWKVMFGSAPATSGMTTITLQATAFTLQVD